MRPIKFRSWYIQDEKMFYPEKKNTNDAVIPAWCDSTQSHRILMQFTGLTDKNGVEVYEGDKVRFKTNVNDYEAIVEIDKVNPCFVLHQIGKDWYEYDFVKCGSATLEVIGNIFEGDKK
jgi:uncharacterized phage protein (TIGR01671 family)